MNEQEIAKTTVNGGVSPVPQPFVARKKKKDITRIFFIIALMIVPPMMFR